LANSFSCGNRPSLMSVTNTITSASLRAASVCLIISSSRGTSSEKVRPPVSTMRICFPRQIHLPSLRVRVVPGISETKALSLSVRRLKRVDLPTFTRPTRAMVGNSRSTIFANVAIFYCLFTFNSDPKIISMSASVLNLKFGFSCSVLELVLVLPFFNHSGKPLTT